MASRAPGANRSFRLTGAFPRSVEPPGARLIASLRTGESVQISAGIRAVFSASAADSVIANLRQTLNELGTAG
ncbi:hypothetical protein [Roseiflexus sp.]|uniref:hypothetical protein n=1 Tax=Roseiflexus sp. TaxID=2562120 RepID=UPI0021DC7C72|nr:hypothetical protein [Roseiflexus sp.]GIV99189.1 MAG: hypothetical protein KatS3mg058_0593 [Roseiflexus sp.]